MKQRIYLDTSVFGGYYDNEFAEYTRPLYTRLKNSEFKLLFSLIAQDELNDAPDRIPDTFRSHKKQ